MNMFTNIKGRTLALYIIFLRAWEAVCSTEGCPDIVLRSPHYAKVHDGTCYLFVNQERFWNDARADCWNMGGEMLSIRDESTMQFIRSVLNSRQLRWFREGVWIGARYIRRRWQWTTGVKLEYNNWAPGEPSKLLGLFSVEDCALMRRSDNWKWHDYLCGSLKFHYNYICEFSFNAEGHHEAHSGSEATDNGNLTVLTIILTSGGIVLLILLVIFLLVRRRYNYKKLTAQPDVHFDNRSYDLAVRQSAAHPYSSRPVPPPPNYRPSSRPPSTIYMDVAEIGAAASKPNGTAVGHLKKSAHPAESASTSLSCSDEEMGACGGEPSREAKALVAMCVLPPSGETDWSHSSRNGHGLSDSLKRNAAQMNSDFMPMNESSLMSQDGAAAKPVASIPVDQGGREGSGHGADGLPRSADSAAGDHADISKSSDNLYEDFL